MVKLQKICALTLAIATFGISLVACGGDPSSSSNAGQTGISASTTTSVSNSQESKSNESSKKEPTVIEVEPFAGSGFGYEWIEALADEWMALNPGYEININTNSTNLANTQLDMIKAGTSVTDLFLGSDPNYSSGIYRDYFEDLSDMLSMQPDNDGVTIKDKIIDFANWENVAKKVTYNKDTNAFERSGFYMLPYTTTMVGLVYDNDLFVENGYVSFADVSEKSVVEDQGIVCHVSGDRLLFDSANHYTNYEEGDEILSAGKDGKYGTYDDGQPETVQEFDDLITKIVAQDKVPFEYSYGVKGEYVTELFNAYMIQTQGLDAYSALTQFDSNGNALALNDGSSEVITWENGYKAYSLKGVKEGLEFVKKYFLNPQYYKTANSVQNAQDSFIAGGLGTKTYQAMLVEGNWVEKEAEQTLKGAGKKDPSKGFGKVDYRMMLLPYIEGQKGLDGNGKGSVLAGCESGAIVVRKQSDADKLAAIKSFLCYMLKNESLAKATATTGLVQAYSYTLTDEQLNSMTPFVRNCYSMYQDTENVKVLTYQTDLLRTPFYYATNDFRSNIGMLPCGETQSVITSLKSSSVQEVATAIANNYDSATWEKMLNQIKG